jgi:hypothetical protein
MKIVTEKDRLRFGVVDKSGSPTVSIRTFLNFFANEIKFYSVSILIDLQYVELITPGPFFVMIFRRNFS